MFRKAIPIITLLYSVLLATVSLITSEDLPNIAFSNADKIFHFFAYLGLTILWALTFMNRYTFKKKQAIFLAVFIALVFGTVLEVLQGTQTVTRSFDVFDVAANTLGVLSASLLCWFLDRLPIKKK